MFKSLVLLVCCIGLSSSVPANFSFSQLSTGTLTQTRMLSLTEALKAFLDSFDVLVDSLEVCSSEEDLDLNDYLSLYSDTDAMCADTEASLAYLEAIVIGIYDISQNCESFDDDLAEVYQVIYDCLLSNTDTSGYTPPVKVDEEELDGSGVTTEGSAEESAEIDCEELIIAIFTVGEETQDIFDIFCLLWSVLYPEG